MWQLRYKGPRDIVAKVIKMGSFVLSTQAGLTAGCSGRHLHSGLWHCNCCVIAVCRMWPSMLCMLLQLTFQPFDLPVQCRTPCDGWHACSLCKLAKVCLRQPRMQCYRLGQGQVGGPTSHSGQVAAPPR